MKEYQTELQQVIKARQVALCSINDATDPELIDAAIYEYEAANKRLNYLVRKMKNGFKGGSHETTYCGTRS